jgi:hypothetical protein
MILIAFIVSLFALGTYCQTEEQFTCIIDYPDAHPEQLNRTIERCNNEGIDLRTDVSIVVLISRVRNEYIL